MKRSQVSLAFLSIFVVATSATGQNRYEWRISASSTDPAASSMAPTFGIATVYLWFHCSTTDGMAAAEFDVASTGVSHLATVPVNGYLNAGSTSSLLLAVGGCPPGPVVAANLLILALPGSMCLAPSSNGIKDTVDCQPVPSLFPSEWRGLDVGGGPCEKGSGCHDDPFPLVCCLPDGSCVEIYGVPGDCAALGGKQPPGGVCEECTPVAIEEESWGQMKGRYAR